MDTLDKVPGPGKRERAPLTARDSSSPQGVNGASGYTDQSPEPAVDAPQDAPAPRRPLGNVWVKGCPSPNPSGRPKQSVEVVEASRAHTAECIETAVMVMRTAKRLSTRLRAAEVILDRAWGRPSQSVSVDIAARVSLAEVSHAEWEALSVLRHAVRPASEAVIEMGPAPGSLPHGGSAPSDNERQAEAINEGEGER